MRNVVRGWVESLAQDVRFAARFMRRNRGFTAVAVLTLAVGIGANTAVYSLLDAVVLHPLPYPEPDRLQTLHTVEAKSQRAMMGNSYLNFRDCESEARSFERMAAFNWHSFSLIGAGDPASISAIAATGSLFDVLGVPPALGRPTRDGEDGVAVITHRFWAGRFASDPSILGRTIRLDGRPFIVVGVMPRTFRFEPRRGGEPDLIIPLQPDPQRGRFDVIVLGRLRPGVSREQAQAEMNTIARHIVERHPEVDRGQGILVSSLLEHVVQDTGRTAAVLLGAVAFLLLIACVNVANMLLSAGVARDREIAIRLAVGASRARLVRQMLTESALLALLGGGLGLALAYLALPLLAAIAPERTAFFTRIQDNGIQVNTAVLAFTAAISLAAAVLFGLLPALRSTRPIGSSGRVAAAASPHGQARAAGVLVAVEIALSFVLIAGAGLMLVTLWRLFNVDVGFRPTRLQTLSVRLPDTKYPDARAQAEYVDRVLARLRAVPGVRSAAAVSMLPLSREIWHYPFEVEGSNATGAQASFHVVSPGYFETMGIPLLQGRGFRDTDGGGAPAVAVISRRMAERYWPGESVVGKGIVLERGASTVRVELVGVVGNVRQLGLDDSPRAEMFVPYAQWGSGNIFNEMSFVLRAEGSRIGVLARRAIDAVHAVDGEQPVTGVKTMDELISEDAASPRFVLVLLGLFAVVALSLAAVGVYAVVAHAVARRTPEIAVRLALGARPGEVVRLIARQHFAWVLGGLAAGVAGALGLTRLLERYLFGVTPTDVTTYALAALVLAAIALAAELLPASRASRVMPAAMLRAE